MVLSCVALRDVSVDEEVLIDYGIEWEESWTKHVEHYGDSSPCTDERGMPVLSSKAVYEMNENKFDEQFYEWKDDYFTVCRESATNASNVSTELIYIVQEKPGNVTAYNNVTVTDSFQGITWDDEGFRLAKMRTERNPCKIMEAFADSDTFDVVVFPRMDMIETSVVTAKILRVCKGMSSDALEFVNKPFRSDMFSKHAFRHEIKIPDVIFPEHWKDLKQ
jgi:hypothetical protein